MRRARSVTVGFLLALVPLARPAAQPPAAAKSASAAGDSVIAAATIDAYAKAHVAIMALRDREQAELAEGRNKKLEPQADIRERFRVERGKAMMAQGFTAEQFARLTQRISTSDSLRSSFEAALAKLLPVK